MDGLDVLLTPVIGTLFSASLGTNCCKNCGTLLSCACRLQLRLLVCRALAGRCIAGAEGVAMPSCKPSHGRPRHGA